MFVNTTTNEGIRAARQWPGVPSGPLGQGYEVGGGGAAGRETSYLDAFPDAADWVMSDA